MDRSFDREFGSPNEAGSASKPKPELKKHSYVASWLSSALIVLIYVTLLYAGLGLPSYRTNDDVLMSMMAAGVGFSESQNDHLLYSHFLIGKILVWCYSIAPAIPWYGSYLIGSQILALSTISCVLEKKFSSELSSIAIIALLALALNPLTLVQFTTTATVVAAAGGLLLLFACEHDGLRSDRWKYGLFATALISYASMIRYHSAILVILILAYLSLIKLTGKRKNKRFVWNLSMLAISSAVIFFLQGLNRLYYETDQWKSVYRHINASWSLLNTDRLNSPNEKISKALETVEWRPIDRDIFLHWYPLSSRYSTDSLNKLNSALPLISPDADLALLKNKLLEIIMNRTVLTMLFLIASLALFFTSSRLTRWQACSFILGLCLLLVGLLITMKLPPRVYSSIFLVTSLIFLFYSSPKKLAHGLADKPLKLLLSSVVALSIIYPSIHLYKKSSLKRAKERHSLHDFTDQLRSYARLQPRPPLFIAWAASFPFELISPLEDLRSYFKDLKFTGFNSMDTSPIILNRLEQYGITNALEELDKDSVIQIADDRIKSSLESYSIETLQRRPVFQPVAKSNTPRITADKVFLSEKTARPDTDQFPDCPDFKKTSLLLYPIKGRPPELMDIVIKSTSSNTSKLEVRGREPLIGFEAPKTTRPQKYAWFLLEAKLAESCTINREISIWLQLNGDRRFRRFFIRLLNDGNMHRYSFELNKLGLEESDSLIGVILNPLYGRASSAVQSFTLGKVGLSN